MFFDTSHLSIVPLTSFQFIASHGIQDCFTHLYQQLFVNRLLIDIPITEDFLLLTGQFIREFPL